MAPFEITYDQDFGVVLFLVKGKTGWLIDSGRPAYGPRSSGFRFPTEAAARAAMPDVEGHSIEHTFERAQGIGPRQDAPKFAGEVVPFHPTRIR